MRLSKLELFGFKSFAKKAELEFRTSVTAIVGPNGSGKSNVVESLRFVLGEQSMKSLRGRKSEDMIFNGSGDLSRANRAMVRMTLDNSDRLLNVDFNEVVIERVVYRDGDNEYRLNNQKVRLKDISELLAAAHIGMSNHHIISQGEADRILNAKPAERKEMIEDALGLKIYQYKRKESERKLQKTEDNLREIELLRRELAPRIQFLKRQVEKIERANRLKKELTESYIDYFKRESVYLEYYRQGLDDQLTSPTGELETIQDRISELRRTINRQTDGEPATDLEAITRELDQSRQERNEAARQLGQTEGQISSYRQVLEAGQPASEATTAIPYSQAEQVSREVTGLLQEVDRQAEVPVMVRQLVAEVERKISEFLNRFRNRTEDQTQQIKEKLNELEEHKKEREQFITQKEEAERQLLDRYAKRQQEKESSQAQTRQSEVELYQLLNKQKDLEAEVNRLQHCRAELERDREYFKNMLAEAGQLIGPAVLGYKTALVYDGEGRELTEAELAAEDRAGQQHRRQEIERKKIRLEETGVGTSPDEVLKEYRETTERDEFLARELEDLKQTSTSLRQMIADLDKTLEMEFQIGLKKIDSKFKEFFSQIFSGGSAAVKRVTLNSGSEEEEEADGQSRIEGVSVDVSLPQKRIGNLMMLSGGERTLTSIALTFAITQVNPPPFLILDETDAALDEANSQRYGQMIKDLSQHSQLILITHNRETMARAEVLYGITMGREGVSRLLSIKFEEAEGVAV